MSAAGTVSVRRVRKAYEQVADQLRELILAGEIAPAQRLPNEAALATQFGVSRPTIREALRVLSAQALIRTTKGSSGGSFVTLPTIDHISEFLSSNINLLSQSMDVSLDEFLEARELLEVPAARLAARRREEADLQLLRAAIPEHQLSLGTEEQFRHNKDFHSALVVASGNTLLSIAAQPIFSVLQTHLTRSTIGSRFHQRIAEDHRSLIAAVEAGDEQAADEEMRAHLAFLRPMYEKAWRYARNPRE
jgi:GntR family transcriptional repressor for pyruvate dehydrogenase complex